jgi:hypothetical protein
MTPTIRMTRTQERRAYRNAVQASLEHFYGKSRSEASRLVRDWWSRLSRSGSLDSGLFLHPEAINTAAGIAEVRAIPITSKNREAYHRILDQSCDLVLAQSKSKAAVELEPKRKDAERQKQLIHFAASSTSGVIGALAKKAKDKKTTERQQLVFG